MEMEKEREMEMERKRMKNSFVVSIILLVSPMVIHGSLYSALSEAIFSRIAFTSSSAAIMQSTMNELFSVMS